MSKTTQMLLVIVAIAAVATQSLAVDRYVNKANPTPGSGTDWPSAFATVQEALALVGDGDTVRIAEGTYFVDEGLPGAATRESSFFIPAGTTIFAGYPTSGSPGDGDRNPIRYPVTLSGDIDRATNPDGNYSAFDAGNYSALSGNSMHVMVIDDEATVEDTLISGVIVEGGNADGGTLADPSKGRGGGIYCGDGTPLIRNCRLQYNRAKMTVLPPDQWNPVDGLGGGIYSRDGGELQIRDTTFYRNHAFWGAGLYRFPTPSPTPASSVMLVGCSF